MNTEQLKQLLRKYNLRPNKTFGQNFLLDDFVLQDIVDASGLTRDEAALEIGPGIATLTERLLARAKFVLAVEKDSKFAPLLRGLKKHHKNFQFEIADILSFNFGHALGDYQYRVIANIPYYITGKIIQMFLRAQHKPRSLTMLVQKEVAQNLTAKPGQLNLLAISVQLYGEPKLVQVVPAKSFFPAPRVDSAIVHIELHCKPKYQVIDEKKLFRLLRACFAGKRKQLHNTLVHNLHLEKSAVNALLLKQNIDPQTRPQQLTLPQWLGLAEAINI